jgi:Protein of unknown function (DUF1579)
MRRMTAYALGAAAAVLPVHAQQADSKAPTLAAAMRLNEPGPEQRALAADVGRWDVVSKIWTGPGTDPVVTSGLVAERKMIGPFLQETMSPARGSRIPGFQRLDYLNFDRVEGRWKYVSMDTRFPVSIMPAAGFRPSSDGRIELQFAPQAFVGFGDAVEGRFMVSDMTITHSDADHMVKEQHIIMADGAGANSTLARYEYVRRR